MSDTKKLFWLAYCKVLQEQSGSSGDNETIFFSAKNQRGPPVAPYNDAYTNYAVDSIANQALEQDTLFYSPSSEKTYADALMSYLSKVDSGNMNPGMERMMSDTKNAVERSSVQLSRAAQAAKQAFKSEFETLETKQSFDEWSDQNYPKLTMAKREYDQAYSRYQMMLSQIGGPTAMPLVQNMNKLSSVLYQYGQNVSGSNMRVAASSPPPVSDRDFGGKVPTDTYYVPMSTMSSKDIECIRQWQNSATQAPTGANSFILNLNDAQGTSEAKFGHSGSPDYPAVISFNGGNSASVDFDVGSSNMTITISWDAIAKTSISFGRWDMPNFRNEYPRLQRGTSHNIIHLVRPASVVLISKLAYKIKLTGDVAERFGRNVDVGPGGYVRIFGTMVGLGDESSFDKNLVTHAGKWDAGNGEFTAEPRVDGGYATAVAITGQKA